MIKEVALGYVTASSSNDIPLLLPRVSKNITGKSNREWRYLVIIHSLLYQPVSFPFNNLDYLFIVTIFIALKHYMRLVHITLVCKISRYAYRCVLKRKMSDITNPKDRKSILWIYLWVGYTKTQIVRQYNLCNSEWDIGHLNPRFVTLQNFVKLLDILEFLDILLAYLSFPRSSW